MMAAWNLQLAFSLTEITNEILELGMWNFVQSYIIYMPKKCIWNKNCFYVDN
jgi:hypothetical protein